jgi:hypothetical protein
MADQWYYADGGETFGPVDAGEIIERVKQRPLLVWSPGMQEWTDARRIPQFAPKRPSDAGGKTVLGGKSLARRARHELISYLAVSGYLMIWFCAVLFYKAAVLRSVGVEFAPFGIAIAKALILGKFMLVLEALKLGERKDGAEMLIVGIAKKALLFTIALFLMTVAEEVVVGLFHGRGPRDALGGIGGGSFTQAGAAAVLMFLVLLPYLAFRRLALEIGELPELLFSRRGVGERGGQKASKLGR